MTVSDDRRRLIIEAAARARSRARRLRENARAAHARADDLGRAAKLRSAEHRRGVGSRLEIETEIEDAGMLPWTVMKRFVEADAARAGRDPMISEAKTLLVHRYGISRGEAFALLRRVSSHENRKLREVARRLVEESRPG